MSDDYDFRLIGDPHITRKFEFGVPLSRRGEREKLLFQDFKERLYAGEESTVIMVGDLLEKPICTLVDLHEIIRILLTAAARQPHRQFYMMAGNHDISPQKDNPGAFDILVMMNGFFKNLHFVRKPMIHNRIAMFPWEWDRTALQQLEDLEPDSFDVAVGHWDLVSYDDEHQDHLCPAQQLVDMGAKKIYSGHWHVAGQYKVAGHPVTCTGSMQPMTHAEDPDGKMYVTMKLSEYLATDPTKFKNKYVRVIAPQDEDVEVLDDCLGFKIQRVEKEQMAEEVEIEDFKTSDILNKHLEKHSVSEEVQQFIKDRVDADD